MQTLARFALCCTMRYTGTVMDTTTQDTSKFVPALCAYHRAMATYRYSDALAQARIATEHAPCESEAARWANIVAELEVKTSRGLDRILIGLGLKKAARS